MGMRVQTTSCYDFSAGERVLEARPTGLLD
jgi:hypothetical protein